MQKTAHDVGARDYRERLGPSLWVMVSAAVAGPMVALVFAPIDTTLALAIGALVGVAVVALVVAVEGGELRAGRAHIPVDLLGDPAVHVGEGARQQRGAGLDPRSWHVIRGGIDGLVVMPVSDPQDPTPAWVISSRTPDRLAAAVRRAQVKPSTPGT
jgi:hypothetical protein